jgi:hypothetical protein
MTEADPTGWPLTIDGHEYRPVPESWIQHGIDDRTGEGPQLIAVSAAAWRGRVRVRYLHRRANTVGQLIEPAVEGEGGLIPRRLTSASWPRSIVASQLEPVDVARHPEIEYAEEVLDGLDESIDHRVEVIA